MRKAFTKLLSLALTASMAIGLGAGVVSEKADAAYSQQKLDKNPVVAAKPYRGYLTFQSGVMYNFRNNLDDEDYGILGSAKSQALVGDPFDYANTFVWNKPKDAELTEQDDVYHAGTKIKIPKNAELTTTKANFVNPDITYDGTYTVSMDGFDPTLFQYDTGWTMLGVTTNIPKDAPAVFSNVSLSVDGKVIYTAPQGVMRNLKDSPNFKTLMVINRYGYSNYDAGTQDPAKLDGVPDCIEGNYPKQSISITFTLSGMGAAPADYVAAPSTGGSVTASMPAISYSKAVGDEITAGDFVYSVTTATDSTTPEIVPTVMVSSVAKAAKNKKTLKVPDTITDGDFTYTVNELDMEAFYKAKKLKKLELGANITKIPAKAFVKNKKLTTIKFNAKLKKCGKNAFKGFKKKISITGKSKKANIKVLKKSGYKKFK